VPVSSAYRIFEHASEPKELWIIPNCFHAEGPNVAGEEYKERVNGFFEKWLLGEESGAGRRESVAAGR
jgi:hypothetical protein